MTDKFCTALAGPAARKDKALFEKLEACFVFVSGLADARQERDEAWCGRQIKLLAELLTPSIEEARSRPGVEPTQLARKSAKDR